MALSLPGPWGPTPLAASDFSHEEETQKNKEKEKKKKENPAIVRFLLLPGPRYHQPWGWRAPSALRSRAGHVLTAPG